MIDRNEYLKVNDILGCIKSKIEEQVNEDYTAYKDKCLKDLELTLEMKRNSCVKAVLDGIDVVVSGDTPNSFEPTIMIKVQKVIRVGEK